MKPDSNVTHIRRLLLDRSRRGIRKYNTTTDRDDLTFDEWCQHAIEEMLDAAIYLRKLQTQGLHARRTKAATNRPSVLRRGRA
jgi:hypothetical protein